MCEIIHLCQTATSTINFIKLYADHLLMRLPRWQEVRCPNHLNLCDFLNREMDTSSAVQNACTDLVEAHDHDNRGHTEAAACLFLRWKEAEDKAVQAQDAEHRAGDNGLRTVYSRLLEVEADHDTFLLNLTFRSDTRKYLVNPDCVFYYLLTVCIWFWIHLTMYLWIQYVFRSPQQPHDASL